MRVRYNLFKPFHILFLPQCHSISILSLNLSFQTLIVKDDILKEYSQFLMRQCLHLTYLLSQTKIKVKSRFLQLDLQPRLIRARLQWYYLLLPLLSPKYLHPRSKDAYFLVRERVVKSANLVLRVISYIPSLPE